MVFNGDREKNIINGRLLNGIQRTYYTTNWYYYEMGTNTKWIAICYTFELEDTTTFIDISYFVSIVQHPKRLRGANGIEVGYCRCLRQQVDDKNIAD
ncbi:hypothetical protein SAMN05443246_5544 [Paenibacillus sp. GP183]|nr:hypothetical protein SAMN05443246_5544 [Paenibacillus sp. GP183]